MGDTITISATPKPACQFSRGASEMFKFKPIEKAIAHPSAREIAYRENYARQNKAAISKVRKSFDKRSSLVRESAFDRSSRRA